MYRQSMCLCSKCSWKKMKNVWVRKSVTYTCNCSFSSLGGRLESIRQKTISIGSEDRRNCRLVSTSFVLRSCLSICSCALFFEPPVVLEYVFIFHIFVGFPVFLLLLISSFVPLWSEQILGTISVFLNLCGTCFQTRYKLYLLKGELQGKQTLRKRLTGRRFIKDILGLTPVREKDVGLGREREIRLQCSHKKGLSQCQREPWRWDSPSELS